MHGRTFRECIRYLEKVFFRVIFSKNTSYHPLFLSMTATMTQSLLQSLSTLTCVDWSLKHHQLWVSAYAFRQRYIKMTFDVTGEITAVALPRLVTHMKRNPDSYAAIYVNFKTECSHWAAKFEKLITKALLDDDDDDKTINVIQIHGDMDKEEKFRFIRLFTGDEVMADTNPQVLTATSAANTGVDQERLDWVTRIGLARCISTILQERGRNARKSGMKGMFQMFTSWKLFVSLILSILAPSQEMGKEQNSSDGSINTMIRALSPQKPSQMDAHKYNCPLTAEQKHNNIVTAHDDVMQVLKLYFLPGLGCIHCRTEWFVAVGELTTYPEMMLPCHTQCFVCEKTIDKYIYPVVHAEAIMFLQSRRFVTMGTDTHQLWGIY